MALLKRLIDSATFCRIKDIRVTELEASGHFLPLIPGPGELSGALQALLEDTRHHIRIVRNGGADTLLMPNYLAIFHQRPVKLFRQQSLTTIIARQESIPAANPAFLRYYHDRPLTVSSTRAC